MRELIDPVKERRLEKAQLAQLAYEIWRTTYTKLCQHEDAEYVIFDELDSDIKHAWMEAAWAVRESVLSTPKNEKLSSKETDNGYLVYARTKEARKSHPLLLTYAKFPEDVKQKYRDIARAIYAKMSMED